MTSILNYTVLLWYSTAYIHLANKGQIILSVIGIAVESVLGGLVIWHVPVEKKKKLFMILAVYLGVGVVIMLESAFFLHNYEDRDQFASLTVVNMQIFTTVLTIYDIGYHCPFNNCGSSSIAARHAIASTNIIGTIFPIASISTNQGTAIYKIWKDNMVAGQYAERGYMLFVARITSLFNYQIRHDVSTTVNDMIVILICKHYYSRVLFTRKLRILFAYLGFS
ncbi:hypothetical protein LINGRAHAP2_LOCUS18939 [Linum grandiflorum]